MNHLQHPSNPTYRRDVGYAFEPTGWILGSIGIWPIATRQSIKRLYNLTIALCNFALGFAIVPCVLHIVYDEKDLTVKLKLCGLLGFCTTAMLKYCVLTIRRSKILRCIEHVRTDWWQVGHSLDRELMLKYASTGRKLSIVSAASLYTAGFVFHIILPFCSEHRVDNRTVRPLVYPTYSEFRQSQISPIYEMVYLAHCVCGYTMYSVTVGSCGMAAIFATHACGQIDVIVSRLKSLSRLKSTKRLEETLDVDRRIAAIVKRHVRVLRFTAAVEEILQEVCLLEFASSVFTMCLPEYYCIVDWQDNDTIGLTTYFLLFLSFCFNMYILCYIGELLMEKSTQIGSTCFTIDWYRLPTRSVRGLVLIIAMSSHPVKISAGRMIDLSLTTFANVLKTSFAYLNFLRTLVV